MSAISLCSDLTIDLKAAICSHNCKGTLYRIAAIVCGVAMAAIVGLASAVYLGLMATPPTWMLFAAILLGMAATNGAELWRKGAYSFREAAAFQELSDKIAWLEQEWNKAKIEEFLREQKIEVHDLPALAAKRPDEPLKALFPLIAQFLIVNERAIARQQQALIQLQIRELEGMESLDRAAKLKFLCAQILQNIQDPTAEFSYITDELGDDHLVKRGPVGQRPIDIGKLIPLSLERRMFEYVRIEGYIDERPRAVFKPVGDRPALTLEELFRQPYDVLRAMIFN